MNSENVDPTVLSRGVLFAVDRDGAKSLFGARGDDALRDVLTGLVADPSMWCDISAVDCQDNWRVIDQCLNQMTEAVQLDQCILGGRPMYQGSEMTVVLVRPDLVPHLANGLDEVDEESFRELVPADEDAASVHATFVRIQQLYRSAAENRSSIIFAVEH